MEFKSFLVKYGEIGVKGKNRFKFEDALIHQIRLALRKTGANYEIVREHGRIYILRYENSPGKEYQYDS